MIFSFVHCQASQGHSGGLWQPPVPSGGLPKEPLHKIPVGPVQPTPLPEGLDLQLWWDMPTFAVDPSGKGVYPEWSFFFVIPHRRGTLETFLKGTCCGKCPSSPSGMFRSLLVPWQIGLPWDQVHIHCPGGLGGTCILPLSALTLQCGGTSHVILLTSGEFQDPTRGTHPGRVPNPPFVLTLRQRSPYLQPFLKPPSFFQCVPHSAESKGSSN